MPALADLRPGGMLRFDTDAMPTRLADHELRHEQRLENEVLLLLVPQWYTMRAYADDAGRVAWLYVALYSGSEPGGAHDPTVCYPAQGWEASSTVERELEISPGDRAVVRRMSATQGGREELVLYWFQPARRWPSHALPERVLRIFDRLQGRPEYAFVRVSAQLSRSSDGSAQAEEERLSRVAIAIAPWVRNAVSAR